MSSSQFNVTDNTTLASYGSVTATTTLKCIPMILIGVASFTGNALVLVAIYRFKSLQTFSNAYIGSLAITDILASFIMPFSYTTVLLNGRWVFGNMLCGFQGFSTTFLSSASMLTLLCFSIYRCYLVTTVRKRLSIVIVSRMVKTSVGMIWLLAFFYSTPPLFGAGRVGYLPEYYSCLLDFSSSKSYTAFLLIFVFTVPLVTMLIAYIKILKFIRIHNRTIIENSAPQERGRLQSDPSILSSCPSEDDDNRMTVMELKRKLDKFDEPSTTEDKGETSAEASTGERKRKLENETARETIEMEQVKGDKSFALHSDNMADKVKSYSPHNTSFPGNVNDAKQEKLEKSTFQERLQALATSSVVQKWRSRTQNRQKVLRQYRKRVTHQARLARILLVTVVIFLMCWSPFAIDSLLMGIGHTDKRPKSLELVTIWLAYTNALCNPIIYALLNSRFKAAFKTILKELSGHICICSR